MEPDGIADKKRKQRLISKYRNETFVGCLVYAALVAKDLVSLLRQLT